MTEGTANAESKTSDEAKGVEATQGANPEAGKEEAAASPKPEAKAKGKNGNGGKAPKGEPKGKAAKPLKGKQGKPPAKAGKAAKPVKSQKAAGGKPEAANGNPFRPESSYGKLWAFLFKNREKGIMRADFIREGAKLTGKDEKHASYDVAVVASPAKEGKAHPSANRAADSYYVERTAGGLLKLHMRK